ncbi:MAG TPA: dTDP-glucose 4,6-dehydratase [Clostridium sp.]|uniref:dTDP-glucose 4,6-dehydratase n=1 Tax=Clostridium sp. TaxID=1506 RepID=UPI002F946713
MKTYLVTGGCGFIGSNFIYYMFKKHPAIKIINLDKLTYDSNLENLINLKNNLDYTFIRGDICDKEIVENIFSDNDIDYVVNFAAETHLDRSINDVEPFVKTNVLGTVTLLNSAKSAWLTGDTFKEEKKFLQISTDEVYGSLVDTGYFIETTPIAPHSPYSSSKAGADLIVQAYFDTYKMPINITRCSNNYGAYQFPEKLIPLIINNCLKHKNLPIYGSGMNIRNWLYVEDHCSAIDIVIKYGKYGEVYNIGGHNEINDLQIVKKIINYININKDKKVNEDLITYVGDRKGHDMRYGIDQKKITQELGWHIQTNIEVGIGKTIDWYLQNEEWLNNITSGEYLR